MITNSTQVDNDELVRVAVYDDESGDNDSSDDDLRATLYVSTESRSFFPYKSDGKAFLILMDQCMSLSQEGGLLNDSETEIVRQDKIVEIIQSRVMLRTLHHESITIVFIDTKRSKCARFVSCDGPYDAQFIVRKEQAFTGELLDKWLSDACGTDSTFRDAFYSWSANNDMWSASLKRIGRNRTFLVNGEMKRFLRFW